MAGNLFCNPDSCFVERVLYLNQNIVFSMLSIIVITQIVLLTWGPLTFLDPW